MCLRLSYKKKSLKSLKKGVKSGPGSISQGYGSAPKCHGSPTLEIPVLYYMKDYLHWSGADTRHIDPPRQIRADRGCPLPRTALPPVGTAGGSGSRQRTASGCGSRRSSQPLAHTRAQDGAPATTDSLQLRTKTKLAGGSISVRRNYTFKKVPRISLSGRLWDPYSEKVAARTKLVTE